MVKEDIEFISRNKDGNWYVGYRVKVQRGIKGKTKSKVDEVLIVGIPNSKFDEWCKKHNVRVVCRNSETLEEEYYGYSQEELGDYL